MTRTQDTGQSLTIPASTLRRILDRTAYAVSASHDVSRLTLAGLCVECAGGVLTAVGTDGIRMAVLKETLEDKKDMNRVIVPRQALQDLRTLAAKEGQILVKRLEKQLLFIGQDMTIAASLLDVVFPEYEAILATRTSEHYLCGQGSFFEGTQEGHDHCLRRSRETHRVRGRARAVRGGGVLGGRKRP